jgi:hypothetical protein
MNATATILSPNTVSYRRFIWNNPINRKQLLWGSALSISSFVLFKLLYPFPDFFSDSYSYIGAAAANLNISIWPIGYSKFLAALHFLTHSDTVLVRFQYFFIQLAALHFFFTIQYFFTPSKWCRQLLFIFLFVNPLTLYLANTVNSDALFGALSLLWITELIWIVQRPRTYQILTQAILLFLCFTIRNNAYYYPVVSILAFFMSKQSLWRKLSGALLPFALIIPFVLFTENAAYKLTGTRQFSLFTGWQLANNALYIYDQIEVDSNDFATPEARELNRISIAFFKQVNPQVYRDYLDSYVGNFFIRQPEAPLKQYYGHHYKVIKNEYSDIINWAHASAAFEPFGKTIILNHPIDYIQYFVYPNTWHYFIPPLSHLEKYNYGVDDIEPIAQHWFNYRQAKIHVFSHGFQGILLTIYQAFFLLINLYYLWYVLRLGIRVKLDGPPAFYAIQKVIMVFFLFNLGFSLIATENILRYQFVPMIVLFGFGLLLADTLVIKKESQKTQKSPENSREETSLSSLAMQHVSEKV